MSFSLGPYILIKRIGELHNKILTPNMFSLGHLYTARIVKDSELSINIPTPLLLLEELKINWYFLFEFVRNNLLILSLCSAVQLMRMSLRKIILVHKEVIAIILVSCLSHSVEIFRELQF
jgi:hypothetical protein